MEEKRERGTIEQVDTDYEPVLDLPIGFARLDLACGQRKREGFKGIDCVALPEVDYVFDLNTYPWPIEESSCLELYCSHFIEHVKDIRCFMEECYRILVPQGVFQIVAPYYSSTRAWQDHTHVREISEHIFQYYNWPWLKSQLLTHGKYNVQCDYDINVVTYIYNAEWEPRANDAREWARLHYLNVVDDIMVYLRAVKPMRNE